MEESGKIEGRIVSALDKICQARRSLVWEVSTREKLSPIQMQFLDHLGRFSPELCTVSALSREYDLTKPTVSGALGPLESKGFISRRTNSEDKRSATLFLTAKGRRKLASLGGWRHVLEEALGAFTENEKEKALGFFTALIEKLFDGGVVSVARMCTVCENFMPGDDVHRCALTGREFGDGGIDMGCTAWRSKSAG